MTNTKPGAPIRGEDGFYTLPSGQRCISVTTAVKKGAPVDFSHYTGREVAACAIENIPKLARARGRAARDELFDWLRRAGERKRDAAGDLGTFIHDVAEAHILGKPMPEPDGLQRPFVQAFHRFYELEKPEYEATELVVANPEDEWAGTLDAYARLPVLAARHPEIEWLDGLLLIDYKTSKGVYGEQGLQVATYRRATIGWTKDGTQVTPPATTGAVIVHLRPDRYPDTGYRLWPMDTSDEVYQEFLNARRLAVGWNAGMSKRVVGDPFEPEETSQ